MPDESFVERAEEVLGNTGALRKAAGLLTRGEPGLAAWFRRWARLERVAVSLCTYECRLVPGLLQSEGYVRALVRGAHPAADRRAAGGEVAAAMERQRMLHERPNVPFSFIVEEAVFRRRIGGAEVTRELLDHVLALVALRNVTLQIMPAGRRTCTRVWTGPCDCWRPRRGGASRTPKGSRTDG